MPTRPPQARTARRPPCHGGSRTDRSAPPSGAQGGNPNAKARPLPGTWVLLKKVTSYNFHHMIIGPYTMSESEFGLRRYQDTKDMEYIIENQREEYQHIQSKSIRLVQAIIAALALFTIFNPGAIVESVDVTSRIQSAANEQFGTPPLIASLLLTSLISALGVFVLFIISFADVLRRLSRILRLDSPEPTRIGEPPESKHSYYQTLSESIQANTELIKKGSDELSKAWISLSYTLLSLIGIVFVSAVILIVEVTALIIINIFTFMVAFAILGWIVSYPYYYYYTDVPLLQHFKKPVPENLQFALSFIYLYFIYAIFYLSFSLVVIVSFII
jgi:hypothetical protein